MKKIINLLLLTFILVSFKQNNNKLQPFTGVWVWEKGNTTFNIRIYESYNLLKGDYWLTETNNGIQRVVYKSDKIVDDFFDISFGNALTGNSKNGKYFTGIVKDNVLLGDGIHGIKEGEFWFTLLNYNTAKWKVKKVYTYDKKRKLEPDNFSIPTDIILIRQKNKIF